MLEGIPYPFTRLYDKYINPIFIKWFRKIAKEIKNKQISGTILDIGTGPGRLPIEIAKQIINVEVIGIDVSEDMIRIAKRNASKEGLMNRVKFKVGSAYNTGFGDCSIDLVLSTESFHHLKEPTKAFNEIYRILKHGREAWIYDGRKDATKEEIEETVQSLGMEEDLPLPLWIIERIWPYMHVGYKTEVYTSGKIKKALEESLFKNYDIKKELAWIKIILKKN